MLTCQVCGAENPSHARFCLACGSPLTAADERRRRMVVALFCDVVNSTGLGERLDPERLQPLIDRYHTVMRETLERHGGTVEKFIGDAVVGAFGVPVAHEDDGLRAVRAALDMRAAAETLDLGGGPVAQVRIGIDAGEVLADASTAVEGRLAGDVFNTAARLQAAASAGEILVSEAVATLLRDRAELQPMPEPITLKGKKTPVHASAVQGVRAERTARLSPLVGRRTSLARLREGLDEAIAAAAPTLVTVLAPAGVGKSRLATALIDDVRGETTVLMAQTPSYGEGVTFAPLVDLVRGAAGDPASPDETVTALRSLTAGEPDGGPVADRLAQILGIGPTTGADASWAVQRLLETLASDRPVLVVVDDIHWAERQMLDLLDTVIERTHGAVTFLCLARPDLLESMPSWAGGKPRAFTTTLPPLTADEARDLATSLLGAEAPDAVVDRVCAASEGNPLFLEQLVATYVDAGLLREGRWAGGDETVIDIPPTIQALLAARLDRLDPLHLAALERASVEGRRFSVGAVVSLGADEEIAAAEIFRALEAKGMVEPEDPIGSRWRFTHALIQEEAYRRIPKSSRATLHEALAAWIDQTADGRADADEAVGRHLDRALGLRIELGERGAVIDDLSRRAGLRFASAGARAFGRLDLLSTVELLGRANVLLPRDAPERLGALPELGVALAETGRLHDAEPLLSAAIEDARRAGDERDAGRAEVQLAAARGVYGAATEAEIERWLVTVTQARDAFAATQDDAALAEAWLAIEYLEFMRGQLVPAYEATVRALACGLRAGRLREAIQSAGDLVTFAVAGPMPFAGIRQLGLEMAAASDPIAAVSGLALLAAADLAEGSPDQGAHEERRRATIERHGLAWLGAVHALPLGILELQAGSADLAEHRLMQSRQTVLEFGDVWWINSLDPRIAQAQEIQGRTAEFLRTADAFDAQIRVFDRDARISRLLLRALAALHRGALADAQAAVREALDATSGTDLALLTADAHAVAARILDARGFATEATRERSEAAAIHRAKGNITALRAMGLVG